MTASTASAKPPQTSTTITSTGLKAGQIKHVWLIILENKSYDATFTGLNQNSYLWKTLPSQGVLLKNYYGTGHFSQDNYISLVSGQAPQQDTQSDCSVEDIDFGTNANIVTTGANNGQVASPANAASPAAPTPPTARTAAPTRPTCRRCSTSSTPPARPGRATRRTSATSPAARTPSAAVRAPPPTTRPRTRPS